MFSHKVLGAVSVAGLASRMLRIVAVVCHLIWGSFGAMKLAMNRRHGRRGGREGRTR